VTSPEPIAGLEDELAELDFFLRNRLLDDARELLASLAEAHPCHPQLAERSEELERLAAEPPAVATQQPAPPRVPPPAPTHPTSPTPTPAPAPPARRPSLGGGDYLYSVEDVFGRFKAQIEQTVGADDAATHYDLGIAYREMGLLADAAREFETALAGGGKGRELDCLTMIGLCRLDGGDAPGAVEAYRGALRVGSLRPDAEREVQYQLAKAYEAAGDREAALYYLQRVLEVDGAYRDARAVVARLGGGPGRLPPDDRR
jgi:tetratricopeptide (TPR) repeat protein